MAATHKFLFAGSDLCFRGTDIQTVSKAKKLLFVQFKQILVWCQFAKHPSKLCPHAQHACFHCKDGAIYNDCLNNSVRNGSSKLTPCLPNINFYFNIYFPSYHHSVAGLLNFLCCQLSFLHHLNKPLSVQACVLCFTVTKAALESKYNTYPLH